MDLGKSSNDNDAPVEEANKRDSKKPISSSASTTEGSASASPNSQVTPASQTNGTSSNNGAQESSGTGGIIERFRQWFSSHSNLRPVNSNSTVQTEPLPKRRRQMHNEEEEDEVEVIPVEPRESLHTRRSLVAKQDLEYEESKRIDREKQQEKDELEKKKKKEEEDIRLKAEELSREKSEVRSALEEEPQAGDPGVFTLKVKLPSGDRLQRNFRSSDSVRVLREFVFSHSESPWTFSLVANLGTTTRIRIGANTEGTLESHGITSQTLLHLELEQVADSDVGHSLELSNEEIEADPKIQVNSLEGISDEGGGGISDF